MYIYHSATGNFFKKVLDIFSFLAFTCQLEKSGNDMRERFSARMVLGSHGITEGRPQRKKMLLNDNLLLGGISVDLY